MYALFLMKLHGKDRYHTYIIICIYLNICMSVTRDNPTKKFAHQKSRNSNQYPHENHQVLNEESQRERSELDIDTMWRVSTLGVPHNKLL